MWGPKGCALMGEDFKHISEKEEIFDKVLQTQSAFAKAIEEYRELQPEIEKLEAYYSGKQWKEDFAMDERGEIPADVKRGVLSEDGIYNVLERNREIMEMTGSYGFDS